MKRKALPEQFGRTSHEFAVRALLSGVSALLGCSIAHHRLTQGILVHGGSFGLEVCLVGGQCRLHLAILGAQRGIAA